MRAVAWIAFACLVLAAGPASGAPPLYPSSPPGQQAGTPGRRVPRLLPRPAGVDAPSRVRSTAGVTYHAVVILLQFTDMPADTTNHTSAAYADLLFSSGTHPGGSLRDYYNEVSRGAFDIDGIVTRWYTAPHTYAYYANNQGGFGAPPFNAQQMAYDAVQLANPDVDFSQFDGNGDGEVDGIFVVHAGPGGEETGNEADIWSHKWNLPFAATVDGKRAFDYTTEPERWGITGPYTKAGDLMTIGVFCHEFGHVLGLPDLYDTSGLPGANEGLGEWELMASGLYNHLPGKTVGSCPAHLSAWCKAQLGWIEPTWVIRDSLSVTIPPVETTGQAYRLWTNGVDAGEYFLAENRQPIGFDAALVKTSIESDSIAGHGLLIYHVDPGIIGNNDASHKMVDIEEGGGIEQASGYVGVQNLDIERGTYASQPACPGSPNSTAIVYGNRGDLYDPWPGLGGRTTFDAYSCPNSDSYCGGISQVAVRNIAETGAAPSRNVVADLLVSGTSVTRLAPAIDDSPSLLGPTNNGDGLLEPDEVVAIHIPIKNLDTTPTGPLTAKVAFTEPFAGLLADSIYYGPIGGAASDSGTAIYAGINVSPDPRGCNMTIVVSDPTGPVLIDSLQILLGQRTGICDDFEGTAQRWAAQSLGCGGINEWHREAGTNHTPGGTWAWRLGPSGLIGTYASSEDARLVSQPIRLPGPADTLYFWQRYDTEFAFDGLTVEITTDAGATWNPLLPVGGYNTGDRFSGTQTTWGLVAVPLTGYTGLVQVAFRFRSVPPNGGLGWWIDDVSVAGTASCTTTAIAIAGFAAAAESEGGRPAVRLSWTVADAAGGTVGIDRAGPDGARRRIASLPASGTASWVDSTATPGAWSYWLTAYRPGEPSAQAGPVVVTVPGVPRVLAIGPARPNPFRTGTSVAVSLDRDGPFVVRVFRADGRLVRTLARGPGRAAGFVLTWDGTDDRGRPAGAGIYFFELRSAGRARMQKAVLLR